MRAVDTNVLVRLITGDDSIQAGSAERFVAEGAWVSAVVLTEAMWVLATAYGLGPRQLVKAIEMLLNHRDLELQDREAVAEALALFRANPGLGFSDCLILETARRAGHLPLGTFDRKLARIEGAEKL